MNIYLSIYLSIYLFVYLYIYIDRITSFCWLILNLCQFLWKGIANHIYHIVFLWGNPRLKSTRVNSNPVFAQMIHSLAKD